MSLVILLDTSEAEIITISELSNEPENLHEDWVFHRNLTSGKTQCLACARHCHLISGEIGWCGARMCQEGKVVPRTYGLVSSVAVDPIEKKPLYHFLPGTGILSIGATGCNMRCLHCQNHSISQSRAIAHLQRVSPRELVNQALERNLPSIASTYNEPMIAYEYVRDIGRIAHQEGLKMVVVDNGYISKRLAERLTPYLDGANIDVKGFSDEFYGEICDVRAWKLVLKTCEVFFQRGVHLEITNLIIPTKNDNMEMIREMCEWMVTKLSPNVPLHFSAFHPDYRLRNLPHTPMKTLEDALAVAKDVGLNYVYLGNVRGRKGNDTYCHNCHSHLISRAGYYTKLLGITEGRCTKCNTEIPGVFL
ncbi:MAG: AmmeMemoRadiSam system radical SAM enzyme [Candidatus Thorarchaeota archaeon]